MDVRYEIYAYNSIFSSLVIVLCDTYAQPYQSHLEIVLQLCIQDNRFYETYSQSL